jgi:TetR/AcrR family transcriptional regulator
LVEVREKILLEATRLFAARGFEGTSLQDVADAVGVKKQSVLHHFPSKEEVRRAVLERLLARWNDVLPRLLMASQASGLEKFEAVTSELFEFFATEPDRARLIMRELLDRPGEMRVLAESFVRPWVVVVTQYIEMGQKAGQIRADVDSEAYVLAMASMSLASISTQDAFLAMAPKKKAPVRRIVKELVRMAKTSLFEPTYLKHKGAK